METATNKKFTRETLQVLIHDSPLPLSELELVKGNSSQEKLQVF